MLLAVNLFLLNKKLVQVDWDNHAYIYIYVSHYRDYILITGQSYKGHLLLHIITTSMVLASC